MFDLSANLRLFPVLHGSGDYAALAREEVLSRRWKTLAVALPPCVEEEVADAIELFPAARAVLVREPSDLDFLNPDAEGPRSAAFVPVEPTQAVIAALRTARQERIAWAFIDLEVERFESRGGIYPDAYALKRGVSPALFAAAVLPSLGPPPSGQARARAAHMAARLKALEAQGPTLFLCSFREWPWVRQAYVSDRPVVFEDLLCHLPRVLVLLEERLVGLVLLGVLLLKLA